jgi:glucosamine kinase
VIRVLGVDGGQSGTRLRDSDGREAAAAGVSRLEGDTVQALAHAVTAAWRLGAFDRVDRAVLGLTTAPADAVAADRLCSLVAGAIGVSEVWLADDAVTSHAGALSLGWGVSVAAGTGVACLALPATGDARIVGGHGFLLGDEGGGFWIGRRALTVILRDRDGRDLRGDRPGGGLAQAAERRFGALGEVPARIHTIERPVDAIAGFAQDVFEAFDEADEVAMEVVNDAAAELVLLVAAASRWAGADRVTVPLALGGRLLADGTPLRRRLDDGLARAHLAVSARTADRSPVEGAVMLGQSDHPGRYGHLVHRWRQEVKV